MSFAGIIPSQYHAVLDEFYGPGWQNAITSQDMAISLATVLGASEGRMIPTSEGVKNVSDLRAQRTAPQQTSNPATLNWTTTAGQQQSYNFGDNSMSFGEAPDAQKMFSGLSWKPTSSGLAAFDPTQYGGSYEDPNLDPAKVRSNPMGFQSAQDPQGRTFWIPIQAPNTSFDVTKIAPGAIKIDDPDRFRNDTAYRAQMFNDVLTPQGKTAGFTAPDGSFYVMSQADQQKVLDEQGKFIQGNQNTAGRRIDEIVSPYRKEAEYQRIAARAFSDPNTLAALANDPGNLGFRDSGLGQEYIDRFKREYIQQLGSQPNSGQLVAAAAQSGPRFDPNVLTPQVQEVARQTAAQQSPALGTTSATTPQQTTQNPLGAVQNQPLARLSQLAARSGNPFSQIGSRLGPRRPGSNAGSLLADSIRNRRPFGFNAGAPAGNPLGGSAPQLGVAPTLGGGTANPQASSNAPVANYGTLLRQIPAGRAIRQDIGSLNAARNSMTLNNSFLPSMPSGASWANPMDSRDFSLSYSDIGRGLGTAAGMAFGVPFAGTAFGGLGAYIDANRANNMFESSFGVRPISEGSAVMRNVPLVGRFLGTSTQNQVGPALNRLQSSPENTGSLFANNMPSVSFGSNNTPMSTNISPGSGGFSTPSFSGMGLGSFSAPTISFDGSPMSTNVSAGSGGFSNMGSLGTTSIGSIGFADGGSPRRSEMRVLPWDQINISRESRGLAPWSRYEDMPPIPQRASGGLTLEPGNNPQHYNLGTQVQGNGDGRSDEVPAMLSVDEYVIPADVVAALGDGSSNAGAKKLSDLVTTTREQYRKKLGGLPPPKV